MQKEAIAKRFIQWKFNVGKSKYNRLG